MSDLIKNIFNPYPDLAQDYYVMIEQAFGANEWISLPFLADDSRKCQMEISTNSKGIEILFHLDYRFQLYKEIEVGTLRSLRDGIHPIFPLFTDEKYTMRFDDIEVDVDFKLSQFSYDDYHDDIGDQFSITFNEYKEDYIKLINHLTTKILKNERILIQIKRLQAGQMRAEYNKMNYIGNNVDLVNRLKQYRQEILYWLSDDSNLEKMTNNDKKKSFELDLLAAQMQSLVLLYDSGLDHPFLTNVRKNIITKLDLQTLNVKEICEFLINNPINFTVSHDISSFLHKQKFLINHQSMYDEDLSCNLFTYEYLMVIRNASSNFTNLEQFREQGIMLNEDDPKQVKYSMAECWHHNPSGDLSTDVVEDLIKRFKRINK